MEPYTAAGISQREKSEDDHAATQQPMVYELVGVVVHSGQASAGHYYSFRKSKRYSFMRAHTHAHTPTHTRTHARTHAHTLHKCWLYVMCTLQI